MTTVAFLHGVGGSMPGWDIALRAAVAAHDVTLAEQLRTLTISFDHHIDRPGVIRRRPAEHLHQPVVSEPDATAARVTYYRNQQRIRTSAWQSADRVAEARWRRPIFVPGELMVRLPMLDMRQAGHYRHDHGLRAAVLDQVSETIAGIDDRVVLFAHSLGSVVALDALHVRGIDVALLVTFGSPLGVRHFWGRRWEDSATFPFDRLGGWLNVSNLRDPVTWKRGVSTRFPQAVDSFISAGSGISGPNNYHDACTYVRSGPIVNTLIEQSRHWA